MNFSFGNLKITEKGFNAFISGLKNNYSLSQVLFDFSYMYSELYTKLLKKIDNMVSDNTRKRKLQVQHNLSKINKFFDLYFIFYIITKIF